MSLYKLAILMEDVPGCGTRFPGYQPGHHAPPHADPAGTRTAVSQADLPKDERTLVAAALDAVRLYQLGVTVGGELHAVLTSSAERLYHDSRCGSVPVHELFALIQRHWPVPPPSPPLRMIESLAGVYFAHSLSEYQPSPALRAAIIHGIRNLLCLRGPCPPLPRDDGSMGTGPHVMPDSTKNAKE